MFIIEDRKVTEQNRKKSNQRSLLIP